MLDAAAGVEVDPAVLAPQHGGGAGAAARVDEVAQVQRGGHVGVFDEVDAVVAGGDARRRGCPAGAVRAGAAAAEKMRPAGRCRLGP